MKITCHCGNANYRENENSRVRNCAHTVITYVNVNYKAFHQCL